LVKWFPKRSGFYDDGAPEIFNSDQCPQFTDQKFIGVLERNGVKISMDGKGRCMDNIFIERLWRSVKYEEVYIKDYAPLPEARSGLTEYFNKYNNFRPHQSLGYRSPREVNFSEGGNGLPPETGAIFLKSVS
jgi:putative transposase